MSFIHLRVHSEYSLVDGTIRITDLVNWAAGEGMGAIGLADQGNLFGLIKFYRAARAAGVKPVIGCDLGVSDHPDQEPTRITLFVQSEQGYRNLCELVSAAQREQDGLLTEALAARSAGLICLLGGLESAPARLLLAGKPAEAGKSVRAWMSLFPERLYLEVTRCGRPGEEKLLAGLVRLADELDCPLLATNDVRFTGRDDFLIHEARVCIHQGNILADPARERRYTEHQYLKTAAEMEELFSDLPDALQNTVELARRCTLSLELGRVCLPEYPIPDGSDTETWFSGMAREGLEARLASLLDPKAPDHAERRSRYFERLEFELGVINQMGYAGYYLIVMEFIQWARRHQVPVGPGRGSGAGSLVAYALQITDLDPLEYDLVFERFLNPDRVSMPDFDIDFCMEKRDQVIQHVVERYGKDAVSQIVTFGTLGAKAVVRDVARVQGKPYGLGDKLSKLIPFDPNMTLKRALEEEPELGRLLGEDEEAAGIWEMAVQLEGLPRNIGKHAGGVVIAPASLTEFSPLCLDDAGGLMTQFDKDDIEQVGLVKFDFLGLRTLTIIDWALDNIRRRAPDTDLRIDRIPLDDPKVYKLLQSGRTTAVFQLESHGMKELMKRLKPDNFDDIGSLVALYRPGPMQMADDFIKRKHDPASVVHLHPSLAPVLRSTYGVILYQEQVMQIAQVLADYSMAQADLLRVAMGKKKAAEMAKHREGFCKGAEGKGVDRKLAEQIFDLMETFAGYGFNKSHSVAYALIAYQTAWLKAHYPADYMAAVLSADSYHSDKVVINIEECRAMGIRLLPPDVNRSGYRFIADDEGRVRYGLGAIRGLGAGMVAAIMEARGDQPFTSLFDFCRRVELRRTKKRAIEVLINSGAMDSLVNAEAEAAGVPPAQLANWGRNLLFSNLEEAVGISELRARNADTGSQDLFGEADFSTSADGLLKVPENLRSMTRRERINAEYEALGLYLTEHPLDLYKESLRELAPQPLAEVKPGSRYLAGLIISLRNARTRQGAGMTILTLGDRSGRQEILISGRIQEQYQQKLREAQVVAIKVAMNQQDNGRLRIVAQEVLTMQEVRMKLTRRLTLKLAADGLQLDFCDRLRRLLSPYKRKDGCPVAIHYQRPDVEGRVRLGDAWRVELDDELVSNLHESYGPEQVIFESH